MPCGSAQNCRARCDEGDPRSGGALLLLRADAAPQAAASALTKLVADTCAAPQCAASCAAAAVLTSAAAWHARCGSRPRRVARR